MFHQRLLSPSSERRGVILMVVLALLTLFAIVGISFVYYANAAATSSRNAKEAEVPQRADIDPEMLAAYFLGQFIFDANDDEEGVVSALRGHSLTRSMYGAYYKRPGVKFEPDIINNLAYNGLGRLRTQGPTPNPPSGDLSGYMNPFFQPFYGYPGPTPGNPPIYDDYNLINYTHFSSDVHPNPNDPPTGPARPLVRLLRDPERINPNAGGILNPLLPPWRTGVNTAPGQYVGGFNPPYTYPDLNNMYLGAVRAGPVMNATGQSLVPPGSLLTHSFHRPWLFGSLDSANENWLNSIGKYLTLRPRPVDQITAEQLRIHDANPSYPRLQWIYNPPNPARYLPPPPGILQPYETMKPAQKAELVRWIRDDLQAKGQLLPYPEDAGGDVKNMIGSPGYTWLDGTNWQSANGDSIWIDPGFPVKTAPDGRKYKPLFAALIVDLDNRINLNVAGNTMGGLPKNRFVANQAWGPWCVDLSRVLNSPSNAREWEQVFFGSTVDPTTGARTGPVQVGRYGLNLQAGDRDTSYKSRPHIYSKIDYDGRVRVAGNPSPRLMLPGITAPPGLQSNCFPLTENLPGYENYDGEIDSHASVYNYFQPGIIQQFGEGKRHRFPLSNMEALLRFGETGSPSLTSELLRVCPLNFVGDPRDYPQNPNARVSADQRRRLATLLSFDVERPGIMPSIDKQTWSPFTSSDSMPYALQDPFKLPDPNRLAFGTIDEIGEFRHVQTQATPPKYGTDWRAISAALGRLDLNRPLPRYPDPDPTTRRINPTDYPAFQAAQQARQQLARDIYLSLITVTGAPNPFSPSFNPSAVDRNTFRAFAQIAVNIVDFIDEDDYSTPFNWGGGEYGWQATPAPGVPIGRPMGGSTYMQNYNNEWVYGVELPRVLINEAYAQFSKGPANVDTEVWVELYNPMSKEDPRLYRDWENGDIDLRSGYRLLLFKPAATNPQGSDRDIKLPARTLGVPDPVVPPSLLFTTPPPNPQPCIVDFATGPKPPLLKTSDGKDGMPSAPLTVNGDRGFFVIGPPLQPGEPNPLPPGLPPPHAYPPYYARAEMRYRQGPPEVAPPSPPPPPNQDDPWAPTVVLQRLACPHLPHQSEPALPNYNPYITIDYMVDVNAGAPAGSPPHPRVKDVNKKPSAGVLPTNGESVGRVDPFVSFVGNPNLSPQPQNPAPPQQPTGLKKHTFFFQNRHSAVPPQYGWLTHLDRQLMNPMELVHVAFCKPALLTKRFRNDGGLGGQFVNQHRVPWFDEDITTTSSHFLYRFFEFAATRSRAAGLEAPVVLGSVVLGTQIQVDRLSWPIRGGSASIKAGDVLVIDKDIVDTRFNPPKRLHENVVVGAIDPNQRILVPATPLLKDHTGFPHRLTVELTTMGDRVPGKININTIWDRETFQAAAAGTLSHSYDVGSTGQPDVNIDTNHLFHDFVQRRSGTSQLFGPPTNSYVENVQIGGSDQPLLGMAAPHYELAPPQYPVGNQQFPHYGEYGRNHTLLSRKSGSGPGAALLHVPAVGTDPRMHPFRLNQLLTRLFNNTTTRSHVFAVWVTVGFFEVIDDSVRPVKLGAEIGRSENRQIQHRFFAIVDRSALALNSPLGLLRAGIDPGRRPFQIFIDPATRAPIISSGVPLGQGPPIGPLQPTGITADQQAYWTVGAGDRITVGYGTPNQETVTVLTVDQTTNTITADFARVHRAEEQISIHVFPGNPGPTPRFNPRDSLYEDIVPYLSVIH